MEDKRCKISLFFVTKKQTTNYKLHKERGIENLPFSRLMLHQKTKDNEKMPLQNLCIVDWIPLSFSRVKGETRRLLGGTSFQSRPNKNVGTDI